MLLEGFWARSVVLLAAALVTLSSSTACRLSVEEAPPKVELQRSTMSTGVAALPAYDAAVSAIDFDPPLQWENLLDSRRPIKLLAAVENNGTNTLYNLVVEAVLTSQRSDFSLSDRVKLEKLAPGETKVVEFKEIEPVTTLPRSSSYRIGVTVDGQQADANPSNDRHEVIVRVAD